ncbi:MAG TPA: hypothetical protein VIA19_05225 [Burkholderiales bacterium]|jgi:hypothetical protein
MKRVLQAVLVCTAFLLLSPASAANYGPVSNKHPGYLEDANGNIIRSANTKQCVRLGNQWSPAVANSGCMAAVPQSARR